MSNFKKSNKADSKLIEVKLPADSLEIGMHITKLDRPWTEVPVLFQELTIKSQEDIDLMRKHCVYVYIEIEKEFWKELNQHQISQEKSYPGLRPKDDIHKELPKAKFTFEETRFHVHDVLKNISQGNEIELDKSKEFIHQCVNSIMRNANALLWLTQIKQQDAYTSEHCLRVGILAIAFGRFLGLSESDLELLGLCGMLHDVGKMRIPDEILNKPGRLEPDEFEIMKQHSAHGKDILLEQKQAHKLIIDVAHYHHERIDGKGYPEQISAQYLHQFVRIISIVDVYDAITSARPYKPGLPAFDALKILFSERNMHFDSELTEAFIRMIGIYPPGTLVEMTNGEIGIVISANEHSKLRPKVELVMTRDHKFRQPYVIDLSKNIIDDAGNIYTIKGGLPNGSFGVNIQDYVLK